jgi:hypothetical protein
MRGADWGPVMRRRPLPMPYYGGREKAWYNHGTKIQSFAVKPTAILRLASEQSPEIHRRYDTNANYLDVHSCVPPWFHADCDAREPGASSLQPVWDAHRKLWEYEHRAHGGPVFGEGNRHWWWSGYLDGVEAQFGTGWPHRGGSVARWTRASATTVFGSWR